MRKIVSFLAGAGIGAANGLFGGGGGMIAVPVLEGTGRSTKEAHATAIAVILPASFASGIVYLALGKVSLGVLLPAALGVCAGGALGARLLRATSGRAISLFFSALMLIAGLRMLF